MTNFKIPTGWSKGEPLTVRKVSECCYELYRSGSYVQVPGGPFVKGNVQAMVFNSRADMVEWQEWWDAPPPEDEVAIELTRSEYLEYVQEMLSFAPRRFSGTLETIVPQAAGPGKQLCYKGCTEAEAKALQRAHRDYCSLVESILFPGGYSRDED